MTPIERTASATFWLVLATTAPGAVTTPAALPDGLLAALRQVGADPALRAALAGELVDLRAKLPGELFRSPEQAPFDPEALDGLLEDATAAALISLCGSSTSSSGGGQG